MLIALHRLCCSIASAAAPLLPPILERTCVHCCCQRPSPLRHLQELGTVFVQETAAHKAIAARPSAQSQAQDARKAARVLGQLTYDERARLLNAMAGALEKNVAAIIAANEKDVAAFANSPKFSQAMNARLVLSPKKLKGVADGIRSLAGQTNPLGKTRRHVEISQGLTLVQETVPIGVLLVIFESRPDVLPQVSSVACAHSLRAQTPAYTHATASRHRLIASHLCSSLTRGA